MIDFHHFTFHTSHVTLCPSSFDATSRAPHGAHHQCCHAWAGFSKESIKVVDQTGYCQLLWDPQPFPLITTYFRSFLPTYTGLQDKKHEKIATGTGTGVLSAQSVAVWDTLERLERVTNLQRDRKQDVCATGNENIFLLEQKVRLQAVFPDYIAIDSRTTIIQYAFKQRWPRVDHDRIERRR